MKRAAPFFRARKEQGMRLGLAFLSGALLASGFAPLRWWWLAWIALTPLYIALTLPRKSEDSRLRIDRYAAIGYAFGLGLFLIGMYWMTEVGFFAWPVLSAIQAIPFALFAAAFAFLIRERAPGTGQTIFILWARPIKHPRERVPGGGQTSVLRPVLFAALFVLLEWARTQGKYAFPWFPLAATQVSVPALLQILSVTGQWGLTFAIALCGALIGEAWQRLIAGGEIRSAGKWILLALLIFGLIGGFGKARLRWIRDWESTESDQPFLRVGVTQYGQGAGDDLFDVYRELSQRIVRENSGRNGGLRMDMILWPEGVAPSDIADNFNPRKILTDFARSENVSLLIGSDAIDRKGRYTSAMLIDDRGQIAGRYDKIQLVPMGEFFLFRPLLRMVTDRYIPEEDKVPGDRPGVLTLPGWREAKVGAIICYESAFPYRVRATVAAGARCIALITDDETFGTTAGPYQHADFAVLRAVETYRYLVRAAHTGTSRIIHPSGRVMESLPLMQRGTLAGNLILRDEKTFYVRHGDWLVYLCGGFVAAALALSLIARRKEADLPQRQTVSP